MPLYEQTLGEYLNRNPSQDEKLGIFLKILDAVEAVHQRGVLHNDIKLTNVLVGNRGKEVVLADFGGARTVAGRHHGDEAVLQCFRAQAQSMPAGAPHAGSSASRPPNADIFALGLLLHQMFAVESAWSGSCYGTKTEEFPSSGLRDFALEMMHHDRTRRPREVAQVRQRLRRELAPRRINTPWAGRTDADDTQALS